MCDVMWRLQRLLRVLPAAVVAAMLSFTMAAAEEAGKEAKAPALRIAAFGDSLSAGYGLAEEEGFAPQLQRALAARGIAAQVQNAAVSGDTSADGLRRVNWMLRKKPHVVIVALGANDMLRALPPPQLYDNLNAIITRIHDSGARVLLAGMLATPTLGEEYAREFAAVYQRLAKEHAPGGLALYPFFLKDVATVPALNLADGIHPNRAGVKIMVDNILPSLLPLIEQPAK